MMMKKCRKSNTDGPMSHKQGFSLVEVLVTLFVLSIGIVGVSALMTANIKSSENAKNQIIASQLAQEGVELVRNLKDNGNLDVAPYDKCVLVAGVCATYDRRIDSSGIFDGNANKRLYLNGNFYRHTAGTATKFYRTISLLVEGDGTVNPSTRTITATIFVTWNNKGFINELANVDIAKCKVGNKCIPVVSVMPDLN